MIRLYRNKAFIQGGEKVAGLRENNQISSNLILLSAEREESPEDAKDSIFELKQKYKDIVLFEIYESEKMLHSTLANRLPVSASGLNAIVKKLNEAQPPPIHIEKQGKFTFYSLEESGIAYVREELLPNMAPDQESEISIQNIFRLLHIFKDRNAKKWMEDLVHILDGEVDFEDHEEGFGFLRELGAYQLRYGRNAEAILKVAVAEKEIQKKILVYLEKNKSSSFENLWEILNYWEQENCLEVYRLIDNLFMALAGKASMPEGNEFALTDALEYMNPVLDKLQASLLQVLFKRLSKQEAIIYWIDFGLEKHLAVYLAEKYENCCLQEEQKNERRVSCI